MQRSAQVISETQAFLDDPSAAVHIFYGLARFALDALNQVGDFFGGLGGFFGQLPDLVGDHGKTKTVFARTSRFDGSVQREKVGLLRQIVDYFNNPTNVVGAVTQYIDNFRRRLDGLVRAVQPVGCFFHRLDANDDLFAGTVGDIQQDFRSISD